MKLLITFFLILFFTLTSDAQKTHTIEGKILEKNSETPIFGASIVMTYGQDSLRAMTDTKGFFSLQKLKPSNFILKITSIGYKPFLKEYTDNQDTTQRNIQIFFLEREALTLKAVEIKGKINPVTIKEDTLEFNAAAFTILERARLGELLKQVPGLIISEKGEVTYAGKKISKMRVNGKDFFNGNIKEFMNKLPAEVAAKVQIIDDYGDKANLLGIKTGEPNKLLNIVTKAGKNSGKFGGAELTGGSNDQFAFNGNANYWKAERQIGVDVILNTQDNGAGNANTKNASTTYNDILNKNISFKTTYRYSGLTENRRMLSNIETFVDQGVIYNQEINEGKNDSQRHTINAELEDKKKGQYNKFSVIGDFSNTTSAGRRHSSQTGISIQDLYNTSKNSISAPKLHALLSGGYQIKAGQALDYSLSYSNNTSDTRQNLIDHTTYYNISTTPERSDTTLYRNVEDNNKESIFTTDINYTHTLKSDTKNKSRTYIYATYLGSLNKGNNQFSTFRNDLPIPILVDSLSSSFKPSLLNQELKISYYVSKKGFRYALGISSIMSTMNVDYDHYFENINRTSLYVSPVINFYLLKNKTTYSVNVSQSIQPFTFTQLQPVADRRNLQRITIGNPNLKQELNQKLDLSVSKIIGSLHARASFEGNILQNNITTNTLIVPDTLSGLRQEIYFLNSRNAYQAKVNLMLMNLLNSNKNMLNYNCNLTYSNSVYFTENLKGLNNMFSFNQSLGLITNLKRIMMNNGVSYGITNNNYSLGNGNFSNIHTWDFTSSFHYRINDAYTFINDLNKKINSGYNLNRQDPLIISTSLNKFIFKKFGNITLGVNDLLNQGNNQQRLISTNRITDFRTNQVTRFYYLKLRMNIDKF